METIIHALATVMVPLIWLAVLTGIVGIVRGLCFAPTESPRHTLQTDARVVPHPARNRHLAQINGRGHASPRWAA